jgi:hypothetical protein
MIPEWLKTAVRRVTQVLHSSETTIVHRRVFLNDREVFGPEADRVKAELDEMKRQMDRLFEDCWPRA